MVLSQLFSVVAPRAGAWIETLEAFNAANSYRVAPRALKRNKNLNIMAKANSSKVIQLLSPENYIRKKARTLSIL